MINFFNFIKKIKNYSESYQSDWDIEKGWDIHVHIHDTHHSGSGVRTHACVNTSELKSDPLDQLGHSAMMPAILIE